MRTPAGFTRRGALFVPEDDGVFCMPPVGVGGSARRTPFTGGAPAFDPSTLALTAWWRGSYSASPWTGTASAGSSGSRDLTEATHPLTTGTALNGYVPASGDGVNKLLANALALSNYINTTDYFAWALIFCISATNTGGIYASENVIGETGGYWGLACYDPGGALKAQPWHYDGAGKGFSHPITASTWGLLAWRYDGTNIRSRCNSGAVQATAAGSVQNAANTVEMANGFSTNFYNGLIMDVGIMKGAESDARFDDIKSYINARYGLAL